MVKNPFRQLSRTLGDDLWLIAVGAALMTLVALLGGCEMKKSTATSPTLAQQQIGAAQR